MHNEQVLHHITNAMTIYVDMLKSNKATDGYDLSLAERGLAEMQAFERGDQIASVWCIDDIYSLNDQDECDVTQISADGEDDGLTWYHCDTHDQDTLDDNSCEDHPKPISEREARETLKSVEQHHDAELGINWDVLRETLRMVQGN